MTLAPTLDRRTFLADLGHGSFALAIVGIAGCSPTVISSFGRHAGAASPATTGGDAPGGGGAAGVSWTRVNLGFVSAYLLVRGGEAALVDTGVAGSEVPSKRR